MGSASWKKTFFGNKKRNLSELFKVVNVMETWCLRENEIAILSRTE